jgi:hypothetical protein
MHGQGSFRTTSTRQETPLTARRISDDEILRVVVPYMQEWEFWRPWHDFKFAVGHGIDISFFWDNIRSAIVYAPWEGPSPELDSGIEERSLGLLCAHAEKRSAEERKSRNRQHWTPFYPDPLFRKNSLALAKASGGVFGKRIGDIRKFSEVEVKHAAEAIELHFPQIPYAIEEAAVHNSKLEEGDKSGLVNVYHWVLNPLKHAVFRLHPELDPLDCGELARHVFYVLRDDAMKRR